MRESKDPRIELLAVALRGGKVGLGETIKFIDDIVVTMKKDQAADTEKKEWWEFEIDKTEDNKKTLENETSDLETAIDDAKEQITTLNADIEALNAEIEA